MHLTQMIIALPARAEHSHAHPADMRPAPAAGHVVAPPCLLHRRLALGAVLDAQLLLDPLKRLVAAGCAVLVLGACDTGMWAVAGGAGRDQALGTSEDHGGAVSGGPVDLAAVGVGQYRKSVGWRRM